jgi:ubiquinone biosynthesis monooxygenase Coq7
MMQNPLPSSPRPRARDYSPLDGLLMRAQRGLSALAGSAVARSDYPAATLPEPPLDDWDRRQAAALMRVNHAGEVSAQALYHGQALVARDAATRAHLLAAAAEEKAHLQWCDARLQELGERPSLLGPLWYAGSFAIGVAAGIAGDRASLGFVEETERQVADHLDDHLGRLPEEDIRSRAIVTAMKADEQRHGAEAHAAGAGPLPPPVRGLMKLVSQVMKFGAYRI